VVDSVNRVLAHRRFVVLILLLAVGLRFHLLEAQSFWNDEGNSARLSERSISLIIEGTASDIHPPLYYLWLRGYRELAGDTEFGLRSLSAFAGILTVAVSFGLGRLLGGKRPNLTGNIAALGTAVNPALVYYSQEARMYALLGLWAVLSTWFLLRWQRAAIGKRVSSIQVAIAYVVTAVAGLYTHYFFPAFLVVHNLWIALWLARSRSQKPPHPSDRRSPTPSPLHLVIFGGENGKANQKIYLIKKRTPGGISEKAPTSK
jgi:uncharacterized membrane protein